MSRRFAVRIVRVAAQGGAPLRTSRGPKAADCPSEGQAKRSDLRQFTRISFLARPVHHGRAIARKLYGDSPFGCSWIWLRGGGGHVGRVQWRRGTILGGFGSGPGLQERAFFAAVAERGHAPGGVERRDADAGGAHPGGHLPSSTAPRSPFAGCRVLDNYTATLAQAVIDCTGTLGPRSLVSENGLLRRKFDRCLDERNGKEQLQTVDDLLGLQYRKTGELARYCFAGQWETSAKILADVQCPTWKQIGTEGSFTPERVKRITTTLPPVPFKDEVVESGKENVLYTVAFPDGIREQRCGSAESCAKACTAASPVFMSSSGTR